MIKQNSYKGTLWSKKCLGFEIDNLKDLRDLKKKYKSITMYYFNDSCSSFRTLEEIKKDCNTYKLVDDKKKPIKVFDYHFKKGNIKKLANPYIFRCETLRGYSNKYKIEWLTDKYRISVTSNNNLWCDLTERHEKETNEYAENTIRPTKLIPKYPESLTKELNFSVISWSGGDMTTYNDFNDQEYKSTFNKNLFFGKFKREVLK